MNAITTARALAPEDISPRTYVVVLSNINEFIRYDCDSPSGPRVGRAAFVNRRPVPLEVLSVCLPLVLVRRPSGRVAMLDVRRHRLARLDARFARAAARGLAAAHRQRARRS